MSSEKLVSSLAPEIGAVSSTMLCNQKLRSKSCDWLESLPGRLESLPGWWESVPGWLKSLPGRLKCLPGWLESLASWLQL